MSAGSLTFSFLQFVHAPGLSGGEGCQRSDRREEGWEEEAPVIAKSRKGTPGKRGNDVCTTREFRGLLLKGRLTVWWGRQTPTHEVAA